MTSAASLAVCGLITSCTHDIDYESSAQSTVVKKYEEAFITAFGQPDPTQEWGFGSSTAASRAMTRSQATPACPNITPKDVNNNTIDGTWVTNYLTTATEPDTQATDDPRWNNTTNNHDHGHWDYGSAAIWYSWIGDATTLQYNPDQFTGSEEDRTFFETYCRPFTKAKWGQTSWSDYFGCADEAAATQKLYELLSAAGKWSSWVNGVTPSDPTWVPDDKFVTNFKITGTYTGTIPVAASEGYAVTWVDGVETYGDRLDPFLARTIVVTGTWNINADQRMGSGSLIVIANGGTVNVAEGVQLQTVNQARIVVLPGGKLTGAGYVEVSNGNGVGSENYNGGEVSVKKFNNNFGKFYNYNKFIVDEYVGGAKESNFYNHGLVHIKYTGLNGETPNARIYNACQWYCENNMRCRIYEGLQGSSFIVGGQLMVSFSGDGTSDPTYFFLAAGALVKAGSLYNNGTNWIGPTEGGYAVLSIGQFDYMNWAGENPLTAGYFANNIYLQADNLNNVPEGNGMQQKTDNGTEYYTQSLAWWKFKNIVANSVGNGNVTVVEKGTYEVIPASDDFVLGTSGCTPGFKIKKDDPEPDPEPSSGTVRVICEDLSVTQATDWDFNDVVFDVQLAESNTKVKITLLAAGGTLPLVIGGADAEDYHEVHAEFAEANPTLNISTQSMINTRNTGSKYTFRGCNERTFYLDAKSEWFANAGEGDDALVKAVAKNMPVEVYKMENGTKTWVLMKCDKGEPAAKIAVGTDYNWCDEHDEDIRDKFTSSNRGDKFPNFNLYVRKILGDGWYNIRTISDDQADAYFRR